MADLTREKCAACNRLSPRVTGDELASLKPQIPGWDIVEVAGVSRLVRVFKFSDFAQALSFTNRVGALAEEEGHHPALLTEWGKVTVSWWTHAIKGLHRNDLIMASRTGQLYQQGSQPQ